MLAELFEALGAVFVGCVAETKWAGPDEFPSGGLVAFPEAGRLGAVDASAKRSQVSESALGISAGGLIGDRVIEIQSATGAIAEGERFLGEGQQD